MILIPGIIFAATHYGAIGAGYVWLIINGLFLFCWVAYVHHKIEPGLHCRWLSRDILAISLPASGAAYGLSWFDFKTEGRMLSLMYIALLAGVTLFISALSSKSVRQRFLKYFKVRFGYRKINR
jgi:hypothetical protein